MIVAITWLEYAVLVLITIGIYYIIIALVYYKNEITNLVFINKKEEFSSCSRRNKESNEQRTVADTSLENIDNDEAYGHFCELDNPQIKVPITTNTPLPNALPELPTSDLQFIYTNQETGEAFQEVEELTTGLEKAISQALERNYTKEELVLSLKLILKENNIIKTSPFLPALYKLINSELEKHGNLNLTTTEQLMLWNE